MSIRHSRYCTMTDNICQELQSIPSNYIVAVRCQF